MPTPLRTPLIATELGTHPSTLPVQYTDRHTYIVSGFSHLTQSTGSTFAQSRSSPHKHGLTVLPKASRRSKARPLTCYSHLLPSLAPSCLGSSRGTNATTCLLSPTWFPLFHKLAQARSGLPRPIWPVSQSGFYLSSAHAYVVPTHEAFDTGIEAANSRTSFPFRYVPVRRPKL